MADTYSFGEWIKQRRNSLRLTQREVAAKAYCSVAMIKKIEADERQPSTELAELLASALQIPPNQQEIFITSARGERPVDQLPSSSEGVGDLAGEPPKGFLTPSLPYAATPFIGRSTELAAVTQQLTRPGQRLLTLLGPGGIGKTRLAIEAARAVQETFADGVAFIDLSELSEAALLPDTLAQALKLALAGPAADHLPRALQQRRLLLILDNCEQLGAGLSWLSTLLAAAPGVTLLATSRERLQLAEEWVFPMPGLADAAELFEQTAMRVNPGFDPRSQRAAIERLCDLVEHLPLAVELAASWTPFMSTASIAEHIQEDLDILATTLRNVPPRHRSVRAVFDYSWNLLPAVEREACRRLAVFRGGWTPAEATSVAGAGLVVLRSLVEKSLVRVRDENRFDMHELLRQYTAEKLAQAGEEQGTRQRHFQAYLALTTQLDAQQHGPQGLAALRGYELEMDNIRAALRWGLDQQKPDLALRLLDHLWFYWLERGYNGEGERWTRAALAKAGEEDSLLLCKALIFLSDYIALQGQFEEPMKNHARAVQMAQRLAIPEAQIMVYIGRIQSSHHVDKALGYLQEVIALVEDTGKLSYLLPHFYDLYGRWLQSGGRYAEAEAQFQHSLTLFRQMGNVTRIASPLGSLGKLALLGGDLDQARTYMAESRELARAAGSSNYYGLETQALFSLIQFYLGDREAAETGLLKALQAAEEMDNPIRKQLILSYLSEVALARGDVPTAVKHLHDCLQFVDRFFHYLQATGQFDESLETLQPQALPIDMIALCYRAALVAAAQGQHARAITLYSLAESFRQGSGQKTAPPLQASLMEALDKSRGQLSTAAYDSAWQQGQTMSLSATLAFLQESG